MHIQCQCRNWFKLGSLLETGQNRLGPIRSNWDEIDQQWWAIGCQFDVLANLVVPAASLHHSSPSSGPRRLAAYATS